MKNKIDPSKVEIRTASEMEVPSIRIETLLVKTAISWNMAMQPTYSPQTSNEDEIDDVYAV